MKKTIQIVLLVNILTSSIYAKSNKEQMEQYWESSKAGKILQLFQKGLKKILVTSLKIDKKDVGLPLQNEIDKFINNPKYSKEYKDTFFSINTSVLKELQVFYDKPVGKKYRKTTNIFDIIDYKTKEDVKNEYIKIMNNKLISKEKMKLISRIDKELNLVEIKMNYKKEFITFQRQVLYPELNTTSEDIDKFMVKYRVGLEQYESILIPVLFQSFSKDELNTILQYASSKVLAIEAEYIYKAALDFSIHAYSDIKDTSEKLVKMRICQDYTIKSEWYPKDCKLAWLATETNTTK